MAPPAAAATASFERGSIQNAKERCWHPGERIDGTVLFPWHLLESGSSASSAPREIRVVLRRTIKYPSALEDKDVRLGGLASLAPFRSEQRTIADHVIFGEGSSRGTAWKGIPHMDTGLNELFYSLQIPSRTAGTDSAVLPTLSGFVEYDLVVTATTRRGSVDTAQEAATIKNVQLSTWDESSTSASRPPAHSKAVQPLQLDATTGAATRDEGWESCDGGVDVEPAAGARAPAYYGVVLWKPDGPLVPGKSIPLVAVVTISAPSGAQAREIDWASIQPTLPPRGGKHEENTLSLDCTITFSKRTGEDEADEQRIWRRVPHLEATAVWSDDHLGGTNGASSLIPSALSRAPPCRGRGWGAPFQDAESGRWKRSAVLTAQLTVPDWCTPSFQHVSEGGDGIQLAYHILIRRQGLRIVGAVPGAVHWTSLDTEVTSGHAQGKTVPAANDSEEAPPAYVE